MRPILTFSILLFLSVNLAGQQSFTLEEAISYSIEHNDKMKLEALNVMDSEAQVKEYKSIGMPQVNIGANYNYYFIRPNQPLVDFITPAVYGTLFQEALITEEQVPNPEDVETFEFSFAQKNNLSLFANADMLLFDVSYLKGLEAAKVSIGLSQNRSLLTKREITAEVTRAYLSTLIAEKNQIILDSNIVNVNRSLYEVGELYKNGFVEQLDVDRLQLSAESLEAEKVKVSQLITISKNVLKYQMGFPLDEDITLIDDLEPMLDLILIGLTDSVAVDITQRPEYQVLVDAIRLDNMDIDRLTKRLPTLRANAGVDGSLRRDKLFDGAEPGFLPSGVVGLALNYPLWDGNKMSAQAQRSKIRKEKRELELSEFERGMYLEVQNSIINLKNAKLSLETQSRVLALNEDIYRKTKIKYKEGVGSSLEVSQAEANLYQAQAGYLSALYDVVLTKANLDIALGLIK